MTQVGKYHLILMLPNGHKTWSWVCTAHPSAHHFTTSHRTPEHPKGEGVRKLDLFTAAFLLAVVFG